MATTDISSHFKVVRSNNGTLPLHMLGTRFKFLGASVQASVEPGYNEMAPITFVPSKEGTVGLIAVSVGYAGNYYPFFLKIGWKNDKPYIYAQDKDNPWVPPAEKLAQIVHNGTALSVKIDGEWYTTDTHGITGNRVSIPTGNLICQYLVSTDPEESQKLAEEIKQDSEKLRKEILAREIAHEEESSAKNEIARLRAESDRKSETIHEYVEAILRIDDILKESTYLNGKNLAKKIKHITKPFSLSNYFNS